MEDPRLRAAGSMDLKLLERVGNQVKIQVVQPDDTILYPLVSVLLLDEDVETAQYYTGHPQLDKPVLWIRTKKGSPEAVLRRAAEVLADRYHEARDLFEKALAP